jgi:hypothetical protein
MSKKIKKEENVVKQEDVIVNTQEITTNTESNPLYNINTNGNVFKYEKIAPAKIYNDISQLHISELMDLEKACALICKHYEISAQIDKTGNDKYKQFHTYYRSIFSELENRVIKHCEK